MTAAYLPQGLCPLPFMLLVGQASFWAGGGGTHCTPGWEPTQPFKMLSQKRVFAENLLQAVSQARLCRAPLLG